MPYNWMDYWLSRLMSMRTLDRIMHSSKEASSDIRGLDGGTYTVWDICATD